MKPYYRTRSFDPVNIHQAAKTHIMTHNHQYRRK